MQAMILAAGRGTRLGELGRVTPKALVEVRGRPLLAHQLDYLEAEGVRRVVINAHHLADQIQAFVAQRSTSQELSVVVEPELLGTAGGVRGALSLFDRDEPIIVIYGDTILHAPLHEIVDAHRAAGAHGTICVNWLEHTYGKGLVQIDRDGIIIGFAEKLPDGPPGLANAGLYVLEHDLVELAPPGVFYDFAVDLFPRALVSCAVLRAHRLNTLAHDIGTPDALAGAQREAA